MTKDNYKTTVIFRNWGVSGIIALFPYEIENNDGSVNSYMHVGQHSSANYNHIINVTKPATEDEYKDLKKELESIGYDLVVKQKRHLDTYLFWYRKSKINLVV